jgi:Ser/Thr protein kinase RdoA (MazF antagonist)
MMSLATLWAMVRTLDPAWRSPIAAHIARAWWPGSDPVYVRGSANFVFRIERDGRRYFLRFAHDSERNRAAIKQEMELLHWLASAGVRVNEPVAAAGGDLVATVDTDLGRFHAVMLTGVEGEHLAIDTLALPMFEEWGRAVGHLHAQFDRLPDRLRRASGWRDTLASAEAQGGFLAVEAGSLRNELTALSPDPDSFGTIHTDLELDNLLWNGEGFGFVDFDEYTTGWRAIDLAKALSELEAGPDDPRVDAFVRGYRARHLLTDEALATLPVMSRLFDLGMYLRLQRSLADPLDSAGTETFARLTANLAGWMQRYETHTSNRANA